MGAGWKGRCAWVSSLALALIEMTNYQKIRAVIEGPLLTAFNSQTPPVPVYFDNVTSVPPDPPKEYVRVNLTFGVMSEAALTRNLDRARGALVVRCFAAKGGGPARCQELIAVAADVIGQLGSSVRNDSAVFVRTGPINGPIFPLEANDQLEPSYAGGFPHFVGRIDTSWHATLPCIS